MKNCAYLHIQKWGIPVGRKNKSYHKDLHQQAYEKLTSMQAFGESKKEAKENGTDRYKIFSFNTYETYYKHAKYFTRYVEKEHPECTTLKQARKYVNEWLQKRCDQVDENGKHLSAWTIQTEAKALGKLYGIQPDDEDFFKAPKRNRSEIVRSRGDRERDKHFSEQNNDELVKFCKGTGLRRSELMALKGKDLVTRAQIEAKIKQIENKGESERSVHEQSQLNMLKDARLFQNSEYFVYVRCGKGGRKRVSPIISKQADKIIERMKNTPRDAKVWEYVNTNADIHGYRAEYATNIYKAHAREIKDIPFDKVNEGTGRKYQGDVYVCRKDESGKKLDKAAMLIASKALGHNRIAVVADNYIRGL